MCKLLSLITWLADYLG